MGPRAAAVLCAIVLLTASCGSSGDDEGASTTGSESTTSEEPAETSVSLGPSAESDCVIDVHTHLVATQRGPSGASEPDVAATADAAVETMDAAGVDTSLIMSPPLSPNSPLRDTYTYQEIAAAAEAHPARFKVMGGGAILNPLIHETDPGSVTDQQRADFRQAAEEVLESDAVVGFGEMTALHLSLFEGHPFEEVQPDHPLFLELADIAAENDVPIDLHMEAATEDSPVQVDSPGSDNPASVSENITGFERLLDHNPDARIVWQHVGAEHTGDLTPDLVANLLADHENLFIALKVPEGTRLPNLVVVDGEMDEDWLAVVSEYPERFTIGSDHFYRLPGDEGNSGDDTVASTAALLELLPADLAPAIACENPLSIYGL